MAKTCNNCNTNDMAVMPIAQHEKDQNRLMGIIKSLIAIIVILMVVLHLLSLIYLKVQLELMVMLLEIVLHLLILLTPVLWSNGIL